MDPVRTVIEAGAWSSQRHWDSHEDEFVWVLDGELTLITDAGEEILRAGDCAAFRSGDPDGHHLVNKSGRPARVLEIGTADLEDRCTYPDIDMIADHRGIPIAMERRIHRRNRIGDQARAWLSEGVPPPASGSFSLTSDQILQSSLCASS
jgi:uncharacterized cupin superfamily protein